MEATIFRNAPVKAIYFLIVPIIIALFSFSSCEVERQGIIDPSLDTPFINNVTISPEEINTDTIYVNGEIHPDDKITVSWIFTADIEPRGAQHLNLHYRLRGPDSATPVDEGIVEEISNTQNETIALSGTLEASIHRTVVGHHTITMFAETNEGHISNQISKSVQLVRENEPPEIVSVEAPDTIDTATIDDEEIISFIVNADDPDGVDDVVRVESYNIQPDGVRVNLPNLTKVTDGQFRIDIPFPSDAKLGTHKFHFTAFDRLGESSEEYIHNLVVK